MNQAIKQRIDPIIERKGMPIDLDGNLPNPWRIYTQCKKELHKIELENKKMFTPLEWHELTDYCCDNLEV